MKARTLAHRLAALAVALLAASCTSAVTQLSQEELSAELARVADSLPNEGRAHRVVPIYAETRMEAWTLRTEAQSQPEASAISRNLANGFAVAARRRVDCVVGGPYPKLSDQLVLNALRMNRKRGLGGLRLVYVSSEAPSEELRLAARRAQVRLQHRRFQ